MQNYPLVERHQPSAALIEFREFIESRQIAKGRGFARPIVGQRREAIKRRGHGDEMLAEIGRSFNVSG